MCPASENERRQLQTMSVERLDEVIRHMPKDLWNFTITGGEPTLIGEDAFVHVLNTVKNELPDTKILLLTNGRTLGDKGFFERFNAERPNQKWVTDISYIKTNQGTLYLSTIILSGCSLNSESPEQLIKEKPVYSEESLNLYKEIEKFLPTLNSSLLLPGNLSEVAKINEVDLKNINIKTKTILLPKAISLYLLYIG